MRLERDTVKRRFREFIRFSKYLLPYWDKQTVLFTCTIFSTVFGMAAPFLAKLTIDFAYGNRDLRLFNTLIITGIIIYGFSGLLSAIQKYLSVYISHMVDFDLRSDIYYHLQKLSLRFFQGRTTGEQMFRMQNDISGVVNLATTTLPTVISQLVRLVFLLSICFWLNWKISIVILLVVPLFYLQSHVFGKRRQAASLELTLKSQQVSSELQESFANFKLIRAFGRERSEAHRYLRLWIERIRLSLKLTKVTMLSGAAGGFLTMGTTTGLSYAVGYQVVQGVITLGTLAALVAYLTQLLGVLQSFGGVYQNVLVSYVSVDRVIQTLDAVVEVQEDPKPVSPPSLAEPIVFDRIRFGYSPEALVLDDLSFTVKPGQVAAFVGQSGAGKTTIMSLILRLYDPQAGLILLGHTDLRRLAFATLRRRIGVVFQDHLLFSGTVAENIRFGWPQATEAELVAAAQIADAYEFINALPQGFATKIGEGGCFVSEGQKQRIAIARTVIRRPDILILDEATSSVSSESERRIQRNLEAWDHQVTTLVVSHRLFRVQDAGCIYVLDGGRIVESGTHRELMHGGGLYCSLYRQQTDPSAEIGSTEFSAGEGA